MQKFLHWAPRILGILAILFISVFALDAFEAGIPISQMLLAFGVHLIPSFILLVFLLIAWKWELIGGIIFILVSFIPFLFLRNLVWVNGILCIPFLFTGILFILNFYYYRRKE